MSPGPAATRYARVLLEVAIQESDPAVVDTDLDAVVRLLTTNDELHGAVTNPAVPVAAKRSVIDALLARADEAMYAVKRNGKGGIEVAREKHP